MQNLLLTSKGVVKLGICTVENLEAYANGFAQRTLGWQGNMTSGH